MPKMKMYPAVGPNMFHYHIILAYHLCISLSLIGHDI